MDLFTFYMMIDIGKKIYVIPSEGQVHRLRIFMLVF